MTWARHMVRLKDERLPKEDEAKKQGGWRRAQLRWEECVKRDLRKAEAGEK